MHFARLPGEQESGYSHIMNGGPSILRLPRHSAFALGLLLRPAR